MPIDPSKVAWDSEPAIRLEDVVWDSKPDFRDVQSRVSQTVQSRPKPKPKERGILDALGDFGKGAVDAVQHHVLNIPVGIAQAGANHGDWLGNKLLGPRPMTQSELITGRKPSFADRVNKWVGGREANYQARTDATPASQVGSYAGAVVGEVAPWMVGIGELRAAGLLPKIAGRGAGATAKKAGLLALEGGSMGAVQPVTGDGGYGAQKAQQVAVGAIASPLVAGGANLAARGLRYATPSGRDAIANERIVRMFGSDPAALTQQQQIIPGFNPTAAQRIATPEAVQAERVLRNQANTAPAFAARESANNAALRAEAERLAGTDADMAAAKAARKAATDPYYASLPGQMVDPAPILKALDDLTASNLGVRPNIKNAASSLRAELLSRLDGNGKIDAAILSGLRENAASHLGPMASAQEKRALGPVADTIADSLDRAVPGYRANLAAYASASSPIRDMEMGRTLLDAIDRGGRDASGNQAVTLNHVKSLLAKNAKSRYPMSPQGKARAEAMLEALQRRSISNNTIAASGPGTAADALRGAASSPIGQRVGSGSLALLGSAFGGMDGGIAALLAGEGANALNNSVMRRVGTKAADSELTREAIQAYLQRQYPALNYSPLRRMLPYEPQP